MRHNRSSEGGNDRHHPDTGVEDRSFWERENSSKWAAANFHFPGQKLVASSSSCAFPSSQFPQTTGLVPFLYTSSPLSRN